MKRETLKDLLQIAAIEHNDVIEEIIREETDSNPMMDFDVVDGVPVVTCQVSIGGSECSYLKFSVPISRFEVCPFSNPSDDDVLRVAAELEKQAAWIRSVYSA